LFNFKRFYALDWSGNNENNSSTAQVGEDQVAKLQFS